MVDGGWGGVGRGWWVLGGGCWVVAGVIILCVFMYIVGWRMSPTRKLYSFRSCVRASEAARACETMLFPWLGDFS